MNVQGMQFPNLLGALSAGAVEYANCIPAEKSPPPSEFPGYDTKLHLMVKFKSWNFGKCGVPI